MTADTQKLPTIRLNGKDWPVKPLVIRQMRVVVPALVRLRFASMEAITAEQIDDLAEIAYQAICPACEKPPSREEFLSMPITPIELFNAIPAIAQQAGMLEGAAEPGEAKAGDSQTGTAS